MGDAAGARGQPSCARPSPDRRAPIEYLIVVPVRFHREGSSTVAAEGAFCTHLRLLRASLAPDFGNLTIAAPSMGPEEYERQREHLGRIDEAQESIRHVALHPADTGGLAFWLWHYPRLVARLWRAVRSADLVHAGTSHNLWRPIEFTSLLLARLLGKRSLCVVDIDLREQAAMMHRAGFWGRRTVFMCRLVYDPLRRLQLRLAARWCSLVLLKGRRLCRDYGRDNPNVRYFLDAAFSADNVIPAAALDEKLAGLQARRGPLELVYFGRLTAYKGVDRCLEAAARAAARTEAPFRLTIIGAGDEAPRLARRVAELGVEGIVAFRRPIAFGPKLFEALRPLHLLLAAPLCEDTPRSALDAMASGIPILAYATEYYSDLATSGAVDLVPWLDVEAMAGRIAHFAEDTGRLVPLARAAVAFAQDNTQEQWLGRRVGWTRAVFEHGGVPA
jgi:glycosyltransferase involved in cell wall biosynthesis